MDHALLSVILMIVLMCWPLWPLAQISPPPVMLAERWQSGWSPVAWLVSEKLDGVRAWWDGEQLLTRSGYPIAIPPEWQAALPAGVALDGELWAGRGSFERVSALVRAGQRPLADWQDVHFMVFDLPRSDLPLEARLQALALQAATRDSAVIRLVEQRSVANDEDLQSWLQTVVSGGGEGLVLRRKGSFYQASRSSDWCKLKPVDDAEAVVIGYIPGKGKYQGQTGALQVRADDGREFRIGTGLSDALRRQPPAVGTRITYSSSGVTRTGLPRFARFVRVRPPE
ncbi:DNA ligase [Parathalassolituus penaei]|uniref:DNA ligase n=1 Tax=Parathalassolituus penaei TaxID=2997323 RepID=A0A9X3EI50_9GAMM|nr:DNA ligase [Parathalassolituus penaei]MCY0967150.1 DNA ligase [Parathalassolituus penaei]